MPNESHVSDALRKLRGLKAKSPPQADVEPRRVTDSERSVDLSQGGSSDMPLSSADPSQTASTDLGLPTSVPQPPAPEEETAGTAAPARSVTLTTGTWWAIVAVAVAVLSIWITLATYLHSDLKTDLRDLRNSIGQIYSDLRGDYDELRREVEERDRVDSPPNGG